MSYLPVNEPVARRRRRIRHTFGFVCKCQRCAVEVSWAAADGGLTGDEPTGTAAARGGGMNEAAAAAAEAAAEAEEEARAAALSEEEQARVIGQLIKSFTHAHLPYL